MTVQNTKALPDGFEDLEVLVPDWALASAGARSSKRWASTMEDIKRFYNAMVGRVDAALDHLDRFDVDDLPEREGRLLLLILSLAEVAGAVDVYHRPFGAHALPPTRYVETE